MERLSDNAIIILNELHTERLDYHDEYIPLIEAANRLAEYEDLGFTPQDIAYMAKFYKENTSAEAITANMKIAAMLLELEKLKARYAEK